MQETTQPSSQGIPLVSSYGKDMPGFTPQELEQICKAFIRLISAPEITTKEDSNARPQED